MRRVSVEFNANTRFEFNIEHVDGEVARVLLTKCMDHLQTVGFSGLHNLVVTDADGGELGDDDLLPEGGLTEDGEGPDIVMAWRPSRTQVHSSYCTPRPPVLSSIASPQSCVRTGS